MLTTQVADRIVAAVEQVGRGPVGGRPLDFVICTGDNSDNCQRNELRWQIDLLDGKTVRPDSGATAQWEGVHDQDPTTYDVHYWHPDGTPSGKADDELRAHFGFPVVQGLLDAARRPFTAHGVKRRWYTCYGNHDGLVQGNFPQSFQLTRAATGPLKVTSLPGRGLTGRRRRRRPTSGRSCATAPVRVVTADPTRQIITRTETVREHFTTGGLPLGHGYTAANVAAGTAYYTFPMAPHVLGIVLDTVNPNGEANGSIDPGQLAWLTARCRRPRRPTSSSSATTRSAAWTTRSSVRRPAAAGARPGGARPAARLPARRAWVNGHTHVNRVTPHLRAGGGGFWEVNTASHVDWPAQARLLELVDNHDGTLSLFGTVIDAAAPLAYGGRLDSTTALASLARELAANDPQERSDARRGKVEDRNVELLVAAPFRLPEAAPARTPAAQAPPPAGPCLPSPGSPGRWPCCGRDARAARRAA